MCHCSQRQCAGITFVFTISWNKSENITFILTCYQQISKDIRLFVLLLAKNCLKKTTFNVPRVDGETQLRQKELTP